MKAHKISFDVYAHVRHARQQAGDRKEQILQERSYTDPVYKRLDKIEEMLLHVETLCENLTREDVVDE